MSKPIRDFFHSEKLHKGSNMKVFNEVYQKADHAMYEIKKNGKNGVAYIQI